MKTVIYELVDEDTMDIIQKQASFENETELQDFIETIQKREDFNFLLVVD